eukprot:COSAG01_NODE_72852_length_251_cov_101.072368_1_plen_38_part_01
MQDGEPPPLRCCYDAVAATGGRLTTENATCYYPDPSTR